MNKVVHITLVALLASTTVDAIWSPRVRRAPAADDGVAAEARGTYIIVYSNDATHDQIAAARSAYKSQGAQGVQLVQSMHFGSGFGGGSSSSGGDSSSGGGDGGSSTFGPAGSGQQPKNSFKHDAATPPLRIDIVRAAHETAPAEAEAGGGLVISQLSALPGVKYVERDAVVEAAQSPMATQDNPPSWGLNRIDQRLLPLDTSYQYPSTAGSGVTIYIIDTGIHVDHPEFGGRAVRGYVAIKKEGPGDGYGHGTHCAGTAGGGSVGVAKAARLVEVKVLNKRGRGSWSSVLDGMLWAQGNCSAPGARCVASLSLGGPKSAAVNAAVESLAAAGIVVAVAAGNSNADACRSSPASAPSAITVGATVRSDARARFSNWGACVDVFAPGALINSSMAPARCPKQGPPCYVAWSGTSMATPHVAGAAALAWSEMGPGAAGRDVTARLLQVATSGAVRDAKAAAGQAPLLLYNWPWL